MRIRIASVLAVLASGLFCVAPTLAKTRGDGFQVHPKRALPKGRQIVLDGNLSFALDLNGRLRGEPGNFVFSPFSVSAVMAMLAAGARGETREELTSALSFDLPDKRLNRAFHAILADLGQDAGRTVQLDVANALWAERRLRLIRGFVRSLRSHYGAKATSLDFAADPESAREEINRWASRMTHGLIPEVLHAGELDVRTAFVVTDAVYFGGKWAQPFLLDTTHLYPFTRADGSEVAVPLMHVRGGFGWMRGPGFQAIDFPYRGDKFSMTVLVPDSPDGLPALEEAMSPSNFASWITGLFPTELIVLLPRFEIMSDLDLREPLRSLGVTDAFDPERADFSGAAGLPGDIFLTSFRQQALIRVTEEGTEAAAVTAGVGEFTFTFEPAVIAVDRPFLFVIRHRSTGTILFLGRVEDPPQ